LAFVYRVLYKAQVLVMYAVLGLLLERSGHGYEVLQRLSERLGPTWELHPTSVYKALERREAEELVHASLRTGVSDLPGRGARRGGILVYEPTDRAPAALRAWLARPAERPQPIRAELHLKLAVAGPDDVPALLDALDHEECITRQLWRECVAQDPETLVAPAAVIRTATAARVQSELAWIGAVRDALLELASTEHAASI
jgi:DNA-binding PadR family transcriptional regulator